MGAIRSPAQVGAGGAGGPPLDAVDFLGPELWAWNKTDLTQLDTAAPKLFRDDLGLPVAGSITPSVVVGAGRRGENWLQFTTVGGFKGGLVYRILEEPGVPLVLPERYFVYARYARGGANTECGGVVVPFGIPSPGNAAYIEGALGFDGYTGQNNWSVYLAHDDGAGQTRLYTATFTNDINVATIYPNPNPATAADVVNLGGVEVLYQVRRQTAADNPTANWWWRKQFRISTGSDHAFWRTNIQCVRSGVTGGADPAPEWDGLEMDGAYVGIYSFNALTGPFCAYSDLRIYEYNAAAPGT